MWIERINKKSIFINMLLNLHRQVLIVRGARQVGKTAFILDVLKKLNDYKQLRLNLLYPSSIRLDGIDYLGRGFFGRSETGEEFIKNIELELGREINLEKPVLIFVDEADRHPQALETIQTLAEFSDKFKFVFTGSNLENIPVKNAATGRKKFFDLYPITFTEFIQNSGHEKLLDYINQFSFKKCFCSEAYHNQLQELLHTYVRIGGMPKVIDTYLTIPSELPEVIKDLTFTIEENVKTVLGEKAKLYEYEDVLRKLAYLSIDTLKYSNLQVQHAGRSEAKKLVAKTVGARVAHKIRLFDFDKDLSKYIIFDCGVVNYLLGGSDILKSAAGARNMAILYETFVGEELIAGLTTRDDVFYWKSGNRAEVEYVFKSPVFFGIDVKSTRGNVKSLNSLAIFEPDIAYLVKISSEKPSIDYDHTASLPNYEGKRNIPLVTIPHYLTSSLFRLLKEIG